MKLKQLIVSIILVLVLGLFAAITEPTVESIEVEKWILDLLEDTIEEPLKLEDWMLTPFIIN